MNPNHLTLGKFSLGMGDRFAQEAEAQLLAVCVEEHRELVGAPIGIQLNH